MLGLLIPLVWPAFNGWITAVGRGIGHTGVFGPFFFGMGEVLLRPIGLHHILVAMFRFTDVGGSGAVCGDNVSGALNMFYAHLDCAGAPNAAVTDATHFLSQGKMAAYLGGLPGAALAMYHCANRRMRPEIKALLVSGVVACVVGGITEPLEFLFLFVAPWLYAVHAVLVGLGFLTAAVLGVFIGNTDGNVIDWLVFGVLQGSSTKWYLVPVIAAVWFAVYYFLFRWAIRRFDLRTPGRDQEPEQDAGDEEGPAPDAEKAPARELVAGKYDAVAILDAIGGAANIRSLDNCITRLRMTVEDAELVDGARLKKLGAVGVIKLDGHTVQVVIGPQVQSVKDAIATMIPVG